MAKRKAIPGAIVAVILAVAAALIGTAGPAEAAVPEFWITGEHTGHQYLAAWFSATHMAGVGSLSGSCPAATPTGSVARWTRFA